MKNTIFIIITSRSSYSKFKEILIELKRKKISFKVVCSSSSILEKYGNLDRQIENDGFRVYEKIYNNIEHENLENNSKSVGMAIIEFSSLFKRLKPKMIMVMGDRYEVIAPVIAASYQNILVSHVQGGEISGNIDDKVRDAISCLSDYHFPATKKSSIRLKKILKKKTHIYKVGCPSIDLAKRVRNRSNLSFDFHKTYNGVGKKIDFSKKYIVVMQHAVTNEYGLGKNQILETYRAIIKSNLQTIWFWPNSDAGSFEISKILRIKRELNKKELGKIFFVKNMAPEHFLELVNLSAGILGNSSTAIRECSYLGVPSINIGSRQNGREMGVNVTSVDYNKDKIFNLIKKKFFYRKSKNFDRLYGDGKAASKIVKIISRLL